VLVGSHNGTVDHPILVVGIGGEMLEHELPHSGFCPAAEAPMRIFPIAEAFRQIAPGNARPITVQHRFHEQAVVRCSHADGTLAAWQQVLDSVPLIVAKPVAAHRSAPEKLTAYESNNLPRRNPLSRGRAPITVGCCNTDSPSRRTSPKQRPRIDHRP
jgi:hypothetical protein